MINRLRSSLVIPVLYILIGSAWISLPDAWLLNAGIMGEGGPYPLATLKEILFLMLSGVALHVLLRREERRRAAALQSRLASEGRYRGLFDGYGQTLLVVDPATSRIVDANPAACRSLAREREALIGRSLYELDAMDADEVKMALASAQDRDRARFELRGRTPSGEVRDLEVYSNPIEVGGRTLVKAIIHDVTDRKQVERAVALEARLNESMAVLAARLLGEKVFAIETIATDVLEHAKALTGSPLGFIGYVDRQTGYLVAPTLIRETGDACRLPEQPFVFDGCTGLLGWVMVNRQSIVTNDPTRDPRWTATPEGHVSIQRLLSAPALIDGDLVGQLTLANAERDYDQRDLRIVERLAALLALAIRRWHIEHDLKESEERYRILVESMPDGVIVHQDQRVVFANASARALLGAADIGELAGQSSLDIISEADRGLIETRMETILRTGEPSELREISYRRLDGTPVPCESKGNRFTLRGEPAVLSLIRDIRDRKRTEEALRQALERAEDGNRAKSLFLATMSHELRTPLSAIIGFSEMIKNRMHGPDEVESYLEYAQQIHRSGMDLLEMVNDILDVSRFESGVQELRPSWIGASSLLKSVQRLVLGQAAKARLTLAFNIEGEAEDFDLHIDRRVMFQVLIALLNNAIKFTPAGGRVWLAVGRAAPGWVRIVVADTGIGIPEDKIPDALQPFVQVENPYARLHSGAGLGLARVDRFVRMHGGRLHIDSTIGQGTTVTIELPQPCIVQADAANDLEAEDRATANGSA